MKTFTLEITHNPDVTFTGELLAQVDGEPRDLEEQYQGDIISASIELHLYKTAGGAFVCHKIQPFMAFDGEQKHCSLDIFENEAQLKDIFGYSKLSKELYKLAGIDYVVRID